MLHNLLLLTQVMFYPNVSSRGRSPDDTRLRPASHGAVQPHTLLLPHGVGARLDHELRGVLQAVLIHPPVMFLVLVDLGGCGEC